MTTATICFLPKRFRIHKFRPLLILTVLSAILFFASSQTLWAASESEGFYASIINDYSSIDLSDMSYTFTGNVVITSGPTRITADYVKCYFKKGAGDLTAMDPSAIDKLTASGNVVIATENGIANASEAVYDSQTRSLILTGEPVIIKLVNKNIELVSKNGVEIQNYDLTSDVFTQSSVNSEKSFNK